MSDNDTYTDDTDREDWHAIKREMYDVNALFEEVETDTARANIGDAVICLKAALEAERSHETGTDRSGGEQ